MQARRTDWGYLAREALLVVLFAYMLVVGGTFTGLIDYQVRLITTMLGGLVFGIWLLGRLFSGHRLLNTGLERAWLLFIGAQIVAVVFSEDPRRSLGPGLIWIGYVLIFYMAYDLLRRGWAGELLEKALLIAGAVVVGLALYQLVGAYSAWRGAIAGLDIFPSFAVRVSGVVGDPNLLSATVNLLLPLALTRAIASRNRASQLVLALFFLAGLAAVHFTDSRGALLGLGAGLAVVALGWVGLLSERARSLAGAVWAWLRGRRWALYGLVLLVLLAGLLLAVRLLGFEGDTTHAPVASARDVYWQAAAAAFRADPVTGVGPGIYPAYLMQLWSTPPARPYLHAHSTPFNIAAESGLLGFAAFFGLLIAIFRSGWRGWLDQDRAGKARWVGIAASLAGFSMHSLVDHFLPFPLIGLILMVLLAMWLAPSNAQSQKRFSPLWLLVFGLAGLLLSVAGLRASHRAADAVEQYEAGDWLAAAQGMERAADLDPMFGFYWVQSGYAYGLLAEQSPVYADLAIAAYQRGLALEPVYGLNHANLAALYAQEGLSDEALQAYQDAVGRSPEEADFWLNLGALEEDRGEGNAARQNYQQALQLDPDIAEIAFWQGSALRQEALAGFEPMDTPPEHNREAARRLVAQARDAIEMGDLHSGEALLLDAYALNDQEVSLYLGLAELALARGDGDLADLYLRASLVPLATSNQAKVEAILMQAERLDQSGDHEAALERYRIAYEAILGRNVYGWGARGWTPYNFFVFFRSGFSEDVLPQLLRTDIPMDIAQRLLRLAELYEEAGDGGAAEQVRAALQPYLP